MNIWEELRLVEQLVALRHLPPNSRLPEPANAIDTESITDLLNLKDETDPFEWLKQNRSKLISRVLLWTVLNRIQSVVQSIQRAEVVKAAPPFDNYTQWLGNLLQSVEPLQKLTGSHPTTVSATLLQSVFQELRTLRGDSGGKLATNNEIWLLLDDLFQLPISFDPLQRIEERYNHLAAVETVRHLVAQILPLRDHLVGHTVTGVIDNVLHPKIRLEAGGLPIKCHEVTLGKSGFALTLQIRISERKLRQNSAYKSIWLAWQGVERITDDLGHHYLVCHRPEEGGNRLGWFNHSLQLICYPAVVPKTREIIFNSSQMALVVIGSKSGEQIHKPEPIHQLPLGNLTCRVKINE